MLIWISNRLSSQQIRERVLAGDSVFRARLLAWLESCQQGQFATGTEDEVGERLRKLRGSVPSASTNSVEDASADDHNTAHYIDPTTVLPESVKEKFASEEEFKQWLARVADITDQILFLSNRHNKNHTSGCIRTYGRLRYCRGRFPRSFNTESYIDERGSVHLQHKEQWLNTFHWVLTYVLRCNLDVTSLLSGTTVKAVIAYITDYITKSSLRTHMVFDAIRAVLQNNVSVAGEAPSSERAARKMLTRVVNILTSLVMDRGQPPGVGAPTPTLTPENPYPRPGVRVSHGYWRVGVNPGV